MNAVQPTIDLLDADHSQNQSLNWLSSLPSQNITDVEILTLVFYSISQDGNMKELAESVVQSHSSLGQLILASEEELKHLLGKSERLIAGIQAIQLVLKRIVHERTSQQIFLGSRIALNEYIAFYRNSRSGCRRHVLFLDRSCRLIRDISVFVSEERVTAYRKITQLALDVDAYGLIIIDYKYSENIDNIELCRNFFCGIKENLIKINIEIHDYIIVGIDQYYSFANEQYVHL